MSEFNGRLIVTGTGEIWKARVASKEGGTASILNECLGHWFDAPLSRSFSLLQKSELEIDE